MTQVLPLKVGQWHKKGELQEYKGEDLYLYINGGAEIYHEYGFKQVVVQEYSNEKGNAISVEVFEMEDSPSAFGIYTFKTTAQGKKLDLGNRCLLEDYYLNFWKGRFIGTLTGFDEEKATVEGLEILAREIADKLQNSGEVPEMVRWLPEKNMNPLSVDYFEGSLGLTNIHQFLPQRIFLPQEGMKGDTGEGIRIILLRFKGKKECLDSLNRAREKFQKSSWYEEVNPLEEGGFRTFRVRGEKKTPLWVQPFRQFLFWVMRASPEKSRKIIKSIQSRIQEDSVS
ncbi:hypothetical protein KGY73_06310 [bacterium]|nr:hypothetical protein [bacterium]